MPNYLRSQATASRLIRTNGGKTQITKPNNTVDKITGKPAGAPLVTDAFVVFLLAGTSGDAQLDQIKADQGGTLDLEKIKKVLISMEGLQFNPDNTCTVTYDSEEWKLYAQGVLDPDGKTKIFYKGYIRRI